MRGWLTKSLVVASLISLAAMALSFGLGFLALIFHRADHITVLLARLAAFPATYVIDYANKGQSYSSWPHEVFIEAGTLFLFWFFMVCSLRGIFAWSKRKRHAA